MRRRRTLDDIDRDIRDHLERETEELIDRGLTPDEARREARRKFGNVALVKEDTRAVWIRPALDAAAQDVRYAFRMLRRNPGLAAALVITLALGVGANSAIFSIVNAVLLRPLPFPAPDRLVAVDYLLGGEYLFLRDHAPSFQQLALYRSRVAVNLSEPSSTERLAGSLVSANFFSVLGTPAALGRTFGGVDETPGHDDVVVLSHGLWRQRFGADPRIIGRRVVIDAEPRTVVGVMPSTFAFPGSDTQLWIPYRFDRRDAVTLWGGGQGGVGVARLGATATAAQLEAERRAFTPQMRRANTVWTFPKQWGENRKVVALQERLVGDVRSRLLILLGAVAFVLLIACVNVANLLLARAGARQRELAVRNAIGAGRGRILRQLLTESLVHGLLGGAIGLFLAYGGVRLLVEVLPADVPRLDEVRVDWRVLAFTFGTSVVTALGFGAVPAWRGARSHLSGSLKAGDRSGTASFGRAAGILVVVEVALAVMLLTGAGLLIRSFGELLRIDPGFRTAGVVTARITPPRARYTGDATIRMLYSALLERLGALGGVQSAEAVSHLPLVGGRGGFAFEVEGKPFAPGASAPVTVDRRVTAGYLESMGIPLRRGRALTEADRERTPRVALINEVMAREHWPDTDAVGKRFKEVSRQDWITVVGVVGDVKQDGLVSATRPEAYRPFLQMPVRDMSIVLRTTHDPLTLASSIREVATGLDPTVSVSEIGTGAQLLADAVASPRFTTLLLATFAAMALALAAIGIYGVLSYSVSRRTREIGVRMALGARPADVLRLVLGHAALLAGAGTLAGVGAAFAGTRVLKAQLFGVSPTDPLTFITVPVVLLGVAVGAAYVPVRTATRIAPTVALRVE
jgi:putative ABC transport system permease protein